MTDSELTPHDPWHAAILDRVCQQDAARAAAGEPRFVRLSESHELCPPGEPCILWQGIVTVTELAPGVRTRYAVPFDGGLA